VIFVGWAKASDATAADDVPTIQTVHPDRDGGTPSAAVRACGVFAHPTHLCSPIVHLICPRIGVVQRKLMF
jgi:hypothetical protein